MPRVRFTKSARKERAEHNIRIGDSFYSWKFRYGGWHYSKTYPRRSQLTQSKLSQVYEALETLEDLKGNWSDYDEVRSAIQDAASTCQEVAQEYYDADDEFGGTQSSQHYERGEAVESLVSELECAEELDRDNYDSEEGWNEAVDEQLDELANLEPEC